MMAEGKISVGAEPYDFEFHPRRTALLVIDMQRDFVEPGGFGEQLGTGKGMAKQPFDVLRGRFGGVGWRGRRRGCRRAQATPRNSR